MITVNDVTSRLMRLDFLVHICLLLESMTVKLKVIGYFYLSVYVISFSLSQSDQNKRLPLYFDSN